jgi:hypothetical protein
MDSLARLVNALDIEKLSARVDTGGGGVFIDMPDGIQKFVEFGVSEDDPDSLIVWNWGKKGDPGITPDQEGMLPDTDAVVDKIVELARKSTGVNRTLPEEQELEDVVIDAADLEVARVRAYSPWEPSKQAGLSMSDLKMIGEGKLKVKPQARQTDYKQDREVEEAQKANSPEVEDLKEFMGAMKLLRSEEGDVV